MFNFLKYNNAVPILLGVIFLGGASAFAATDPSAIYSQQDHVVSVDNRYIASADLPNFTPKVEITGVTEDTDAYYVAYAFSTIDVKDYRWQPVAKNDTLTVQKSWLTGVDLGTYTSNQFAQLIGHEVERLKESQVEARKQVTQQVVATSYGGLVGKLFDTTTKIIEPQQDQGGIDAAAQAAALGDATSSPSNSQTSSTDTSTTPSTPAPPTGDANDHDTALLSLQVLGNNPSHISLHTGYSDLGVLLVCPSAPNLGYKIYQDGKEVSEVMLDTSNAGTTTIQYKATDPNGNEAVATRLVIVE